MDELIKILEAQVQDAATKRTRAHFEYNYRGYAFHCVQRAEGRLTGATNALAAAKQFNN